MAYKIIDVDALESLLEDNKEPMANKMLMGIWLYKIKKFIEECPDYEPLAEYEVIETIIDNDKTNDNDSIHHLC